MQFYKVKVLSKSGQARSKAQIAELLHAVLQDSELALRFPLPFPFPFPIPGLSAPRQECEKQD